MLHACMLGGGGKSTIGYYIISSTTPRSDLQLVTQATSAELGGLTNPKVSRSCFFSTERRGGLRHSRDMLVPMSLLSLSGGWDHFPYCTGVILVTSGPHTEGLLCGLGGLPSTPPPRIHMFFILTAGGGLAGCPPPPQKLLEKRGDRTATKSLRRWVVLLGLPSTSTMTLESSDWPRQRASGNLKSRAAGAPAVSADLPHATMSLPWLCPVP